MRLKRSIDMVGSTTFVQALPKASLMSANVTGTRAGNIKRNTVD